MQTMGSHRYSERGYLNPLVLELDIYSLAHHLCKIWIFYETKKGNIRKYTTFCEGIKEDGERKSKKIIKYICWLNILKRVLWGVAVRLSYI